MSREIGSMPPQTYELREGIRNGFRSQNELAAPQHESFDKFEPERLSSSCHERKLASKSVKSREREKERSTYEILNSFIDGVIVEQWPHVINS